MSNPWKYSAEGNVITATKPRTGAKYSFMLDEVESSYTISQKIKNFPRRVQSLFKYKLRDIK